MEGFPEPIKLASMSHAMAKEFVESTRKMLEDKDTPTEAWIARQHKTIIEALSRATGTNSFSEAHMADEFDGPTLDAMYLFILEKSGLRPTGSASGEAKAVSTLPASRAA